MLSRSVVIDTNVLVSAALKAGSKPARILVHALRGDISPIICPAIVQEYREVFARPKFRRWSFPPLWFDEFLRHAIHVPLDPSLSSYAELPDRDDAVFLALAAQQGACLITGNLADFPKTLRGRVEAVSVADYVAWLESVGTG
ncbi:MAG: putative toxin-antitoxin system toxin component, PIN family [Bdellovibrionota bacterium]